MTALRAALASASAATLEDAALTAYPLRQVMGLQLWILGAFSASAASLAAIAMLFAFSGTYAVMAFIVAQRTREFGIRIALGATTRDIIRGVAASAATMAGIGTAIGVVMAFGLSRLFNSAIGILPSFGPQPYAIGIVTIIAAALAAASIPSRRAAGVDPSEALRAE